MSTDTRTSRVGSSQINEEMEDFDGLMKDTGPHSRDKRAGPSKSCQNRKKNGKRKVNYENAVVALTSAFIAKLERDVSSKKSRQIDPFSKENIAKMVDIIASMVEFDSDQQVEAIEFFRLNKDAQNLFLKFSHEMRVAYIREVIIKQ